MLQHFSRLFSRTYTVFKREVIVHKIYKILKYKYAIRRFASHNIHLIHENDCGISLSFQILIIVRIIELIL